MRKAFVSFILEAEKMKRLLIALALCLVLSPVAEAKKVTLSARPIGEIPGTSSSDTSSGTPVTVCTYTYQGRVSALVNLRTEMSLHLAVIVNDDMMDLRSWHFGWYPGREISWNASYKDPSFVIVGEDTEWTLAWVIESFNDKNQRVRIVDAVEISSGTCTSD